MTRLMLYVTECHYISNSHTPDGLLIDPQSLIIVKDVRVLLIILKICIKPRNLV